LEKHSDKAGNQLTTVNKQRSHLFTHAKKRMRKIRNALQTIPRETWLLAPTGFKPRWTTAQTDDTTIVAGVRMFAT
jgi:hypothetical protein